MNFLGDSERDQLLGAAFDEPCLPYRVANGKDEMVLRPFSVGVFRRAMTMGIDAVRIGFGPLEDDELRLVANCEQLAWLLNAPEESVMQAIRTARWKAAVATYQAAGPLTFGQLAIVRMEVERALRLIRAAMFGIVKRPPLGEAMERAEEDERAAEPSDILTPGRLTAITLGIFEKTHWTEHYVQERLPLCRLLQYAHGVQWSNPRVWTVDPWGTTIQDDGDPFAGMDEVREVRGAEPIEF